MPVMPTAASPITLTTSLSGWASLVPIARPSENPSCVEWPQAMYERGVRAGQNTDWMSRRAPDSWVRIVVSGSSTDQSSRNIR